MSDDQQQRAPGEARDPHEAQGAQGAQGTRAEYEVQEMGSGAVHQETREAKEHGMSARGAHGGAAMDPTEPLAHRRHVEREAEVEASFIVARRPRFLLPRREWIAAGVGLLVGALLMVLVLALLAPQPDAATSAGAPSGDVTVQMDDTFLTDALATALNQASLPFTVTNIHAHAEAGNVVRVSGDTFAALPLQPARRLTAMVHLSVQNGELHAHVQSLTVGGLALPGFVTGALEVAINQQFAVVSSQMVAGGKRYVVSGVQTAPGTLTLTLRRA